MKLFKGGQTRKSTGFYWGEIMHSDGKSCDCDQCALLDEHLFFLVHTKFLQCYAIIPDFLSIFCHSMTSPHENRKKRKRIGGNRTRDARPVDNLYTKRRLLSAAAKTVMKRGVGRRLEERSGSRLYGNMEL